METTVLFQSEARLEKERNNKINDTKSNNNDKECVGLQGRENI